MSTTSTPKKSNMVKGEDVTNKEVRYEVRILFRDKTIEVEILQETTGCKQLSYLLAVQKRAMVFVVYGP